MSQTHEVRAIMAKLAILAGVGLGMMGEASAASPLPPPTYTAQLSADGFLGEGKTVTQGDNYGDLSNLSPTSLGVSNHFTAYGQDYFSDAKTLTSNVHGGTVTVNADSNQAGASAYASLTYYFTLTGPATTTPVPISIVGEAGAQTASVNPGYAYGSSRITVDYESSINVGGEPYPLLSRYLENFGNGDPSAAIDQIINVLPNYGSYSGRVILEAQATAGEFGFGENIYTTGFPYTGVAEAYIDPIISIADPDLAKLYTLQIGLPEVVTVPTAVPEPSTWAMMLVGFVGLGFASYRRAARRVEPCLLA